MADPAKIAARWVEHSKQGSTWLAFVEGQIPNIRESMDTMRSLLPNIRQEDPAMGKAAERCVKSLEEAWQAMRTVLNIYEDADLIRERSDRGRYGASSEET
jgi:hypothetical protein